MMLKEKCSMTDSEWEERQKTRQLEMEACSKALAVLSSDDAHDLFTKTFNPSLLQKESSMHSERSAQASKLLSRVAQKVQNPRLATLAVRVRLDAFTKVKKAIDDMVAALLKEKEDEIKHKDFCTDEFNKNDLQTERKEREKADLIAKIEDLTMTIDQLTKAIDTLKSEIAEMQVQLKRAGEDREKENKEFQMTVADQRATQKLLTAALNILKGFYEKKAAALLQTSQEPAGPPPPPGFEAYKKNAAAGGVMGMIQQIINDAKAMEAEVIRSEEDAQKAYEDFVKETNASIEAKNKDIVNKSESKATARERGPPGGQPPVRGEVPRNGGQGLRAHGRAAAEPSGPKEARGREPANGEEVPRDREAGGQLEHQDRDGDRSCTIGRAAAEGCRGSVQHAQEAEQADGGVHRACAEGAGSRRTQGSGRSAAGSVAPDAERLPGVSRGQHGGREERLQGGAEKGLRPAQRARARELAAPGVDRLVGCGSCAPQV